MNYVVGHMMGGFDGMVHADLLNASQSDKTEFLIWYDNGTCKRIKVNDDSLLYNQLMDKVE